MKAELVPAILVKTYPQFVRQVKQVKGQVKTVHLDVMDGQFVNNKTFSDPVKAAKFRHGLKLGVHMMVEDPQAYLADWAKAGAFRYIFHREAVKNEDDVAGLIKKIKSVGMLAGIAINPETPVSSIKKFLPQLDAVLVMGVKPGWGGQPFQKNALAKVKQLKKFKNLSVGVDGGVKLENASAIIKAGADFLIAGTAIYKSKDPSETIRQFKKIIATAR